MYPGEESVKEASRCLSVTAFFGGVTTVRTEAVAAYEEGEGRTVRLQRSSGFVTSAC